MSVVNIIPSNIINAIDISKAVSGKDMVANDEREAYGMFADSVRNIKVIMQSYICVVATSFGKDSTVVMLAAIQALRELISEGKVPKDKPLVLTNIDTAVENHLVQILSLYEQDRLATFAKETGLNIDMRVGTPPLAKQWASLFLSGLKIISTARVNNDCSEIMKIDNAALIERSVTKDYGDRVVTLLGSRSIESTRRAESIRKHGHDTLTAEDLISRDSDSDNVFAPIVSMTDEHVWTILRCAGDEPLVKSYAGLPPIPSYAKNHRLLHIIYSDSKDGSCPTSSKRIKGDAQKAGGCGGSARTGCFLCAKIQNDKSAEAQAKQIRHQVISANIIKVRNYIMYVAQDNRFRTFHSRAVDETTGAVALQPNVLNAETLDKIIWLLSQATHDDLARAEAFTSLVSQGKEMEDAGYRDIFEDPFMSDEDKSEFSLVYKRYAGRHLIKPMSAKIAMYLSLIHSRDGVRLPPYRALHVWNATYGGERIAYPEVDPKQAIIDDVPDAIMIVPAANVAYMAPNSSEDLLDPTQGSECEWQPVPVSSGIPMKIAKYYLSKTEIGKYADLKDSENVSVGHIFSDILTNKIRSTVSSSERKFESSGRAITKRRKINGESVITQRGRTRVGSASFGVRQVQPNFVRKNFSPVTIFAPTQRMHHWVMDYFESPTIGGYDLDTCQVADWINIEGIERALEEHNNFTSYYEKNDKTIYRYGGMGPFNTMLRYGLFKLTQNSKRHAARIVRRTTYFNALGLLSLNDAELIKLTQKANGKAELNVNHFREDMTCTVPMAVDGIYTMKAYRTYKAKHLLTHVRPRRNTERKLAKKVFSDFWENPVNGVCEQLDSIITEWTGEYNRYAEDYALASALKSELRGFDGIHIPRQYLLTNGFIQYFEDIFASPEGWYSFLDQKAKRHFKDNHVDRLSVAIHARALLDELVRGKLATFEAVLKNIETSAGERTLYYWISHQHETVKNSAINTLKKELEIISAHLGNEQHIVANTFSINDVAVQEGAMQW